MLNFKDHISFKCTLQENSGYLEDFRMFFKELINKNIFHIFRLSSIKFFKYTLTS